MPTPTHGVKHHIHTGSHPPVFAKSFRLYPEKLEIAKAEVKHLESASIVRRSKGDAVGVSLAHGAQKRWILATLFRLSPSQFGDKP